MHTLCRKPYENHESNPPPDEPLRKLELLIDRTSLEVFVNDGVVSSTQFVLPRGNGLSAKAEGGPVRIGALRIHPLASAWPDATALER
ncbi:MAG: GH32 C-terminal domain-containing protein [Verrucomicrobia bacterium]|nr:GH32 C-terminal domain-containing protein [Verrucomicrobiota bacterium]